MARIPVPVGTYNSQTLPLGDADLAADNYILWRTATVAARGGRLLTMLRAAITRADT